MLDINNSVRISIIGLGYVGLPLAVEFSRKYPTLGFDISNRRIQELNAGHDRTLEVDEAVLQGVLAEGSICFSGDPASLAKCNIHIVTVPTPIDRHKRPDLTPLIVASETLGRHLKPGDTVIYESTVYPGATEEDCVPVLERVSGLKYNVDFHCGYSPERINPGDRQHTVTNIKKVTAGSTPEVALKVDTLYASIITAGTHLAPSIRVAEAAKVIENTQRDVNIGLINELAMLFNCLGIDTQAVLEAAGTKWNFLPFRPGLVGGHCIGVDPYYLTHKAQEVGYHPDMILAGRRINDGMGAYVASQLMQLMTKKRLHVVGSRILVLGLTFKENCPDLRNTRVVDLIESLQKYHAHVDVHDPWVDAAEAKTESGVNITTQPEASTYDAVVLAVAHRQFAELGAAGVRALCKPSGVVYDIKHVLPVDQVDARL